MKQVIVKLTRQEATNFKAELCTDEEKKTGVHRDIVAQVYTGHNVEYISCMMPGRQKIDRIRDVLTGKQHTGRTNEEVVQDCNELAARFYLMTGYQGPEGFVFRESSHPQERLMWDMAVAAFETVNGTCVESALAEIEED